MECLATLTALANPGWWPAQANAVKGLLAALVEFQVAFGKEDEDA